MSQAVNEDVSLSDLITRATAILVVKNVKPYVDRVSESILPVGSEFAGRNNPPFYEPPYKDTSEDTDKMNFNFPPFQYNRYHFVIQEVITSRGGLFKVGNTLLVRGSDHDLKRRLWENYYLNGKRRIPIFRRYRTSVESDDIRDKELIIFIDEDTPEFVFENAFEAISKKELIIQNLPK